MKRLQLTLLGDFQARISGHPVGIRSNKAKGLLAYVALSRGQLRSRSELLALLWSDRGEEQARRSLRQELTVLRRVLGDEAPLIVDRETVALASAHTDTDVAQLERFANEPDSALLDDGLPPQGELLSGLVIRDPAFDEWVTAERRRIETLAIRAHTQLLAAQREAGDYNAVRQTATKLLALDPVNENAYRALMEAYVAAGERGLALVEYETLHGQLTKELGVLPEPETEALYHAIREQSSESPNVSTETSGPKAMAYRIAAPGAEQPRYGHRAYARERRWFGVTAVGLIVVASAVAFVLWSEWQERERRFAAQAKMFEAELEQAALEKRHLAEEAELVTVRVKAEAETRRLQERAELERALAKLEKALALKQMELARLDEAHRQAQREHELERERRRASVAERDAKLNERMMALETERVRLERAWLELEAVRADAEAEQQAELERLQLEEARRQTEVEREREALEAARRGFEAERARTEAKRREEIARVHAEEAAKRAVLERERDELVRQRDELLLRLSQIEPQLANKDQAVLPAIGPDASTQPVNELAAVEAWRKTEANIQRASLDDAVLESTRASDSVQPEPPSQRFAVWQPHKDIIDSETSDRRYRPHSVADTGNVATTRSKLATTVGTSSMPAPSTPYKVGIFPADASQKSTQFAEPIESHVGDSISSYVQSHNSLEVAYSYYADPSPASGIKRKQVWLRTPAWGEPNLKAITTMANSLEVQAVALAWYKPNPGARSVHNSRIWLYVLDVELGKAYRVEGTGQQMQAMMRQVFSELIAGRQTPTYEFAIFPPQTNRPGETSAPIIELAVKRRLRSFVDKNTSLRLAYDFESVPPGETVVKRDQIWPERFDRTGPVLKSVTKLAERLEVQGVVTAWFNARHPALSTEGGPVSVYLIDVRQGAMYAQNGVVGDISVLAQAAFSDFIAGRNRASIE